VEGMLVINDVWRAQLRASLKNCGRHLDGEFYVLRAATITDKECGTGGLKNGQRCHVS